MFFLLNSDKNDVVAGTMGVASDGFVMTNGARGGHRTQRLRARLCLTAAFILSLMAESLFAAPPLFDTSVRIGTPFFARVQFPTPVRANQGLIRLPSEAEVADIGGTWRPLHSSLELVPSVSKLGVYYLISRIPIDRDSFDIYLAQEGVDSLDIFAFDVRLVGGATRVSVQTLKSQPGLAARSGARSPSNRSNTYSQPAPETLVYPKTPPSQPYAESSSQARPVQPKAKPRDVELDDDLSEKLRDLIAAQAASYQKTEAKPADSKDGKASVDTETNSVETDSESASTRPKISTTLEPAALGTAQSVAGHDGPVMVTAPILEREIPPTPSSGGLFDWQLSMAELLFIALVGWMVYFGKVVLGLQTRLLKSSGSKDAAASDKQSPETGRIGFSERIQPSAEAARSSSSGSGSASALADVLRTAAEQAERSERLGAQSRLDARLAGLASAQQQALFECATRLQGLTTATEFSGAGAVAGQMPVQAPSQTASQNLSQVQAQPGVAEPGRDTRPQQQAAPSAGDAQARSDATTPPQAPPLAGPQSNPSDQRRMGPPRGAKPRTPVAPNAPTRRQGPAPTTPVPPQAASDNKPPVPSQDYSEQISLAVVYFNMGEVETARELLETVIKDGSADEKAEARKFMQENFDG